jgi:hypothetical protein
LFAVPSESLSAARLSGNIARRRPPGRDPGSAIGIRPSIWIAYARFWATDLLVVFSPLRRVRDVSDLAPDGTVATGADELNYRHIIGGPARPGAGRVAEVAEALPVWAPAFVGYTSYPHRTLS